MLLLLLPAVHSCALEGWCCSDTAKGGQSALACLLLPGCLPSPDACDPRCALVAQAPWICVDLVHDKTGVGLALFVVCACQGAKVEC